MIENRKCNAEEYDAITKHISALLWLNENGGWETVSKRLMPEGFEWPRFKDGTLVKIGDGFADGIGGVDCVRYVSFEPNYYSLHGKCGTTTYQYGDFVERPKIIGEDGKQIVVGETVYGQDAKAWEVTGFNYRSQHSVIGKNGDSVRDLKPEWLSHEKPMTIEDIEEYLKSYAIGYYGAGEMVPLNVADNAMHMLKEFYKRTANIKQ